MNEQTHRWIRTINGFAGRNGYIVKVKGGYEAFYYNGANNPAPDFFKKASVAKAHVETMEYITVEKYHIDSPVSWDK